MYFWCSRFFAGAQMFVSKNIFMISEESSDLVFIEING